MECESNNHLPFLDVLLIKKEDGTLGRRVYRKSTHTDLYLHSSSHHHPSQKVGILKTLALRALRICDNDNLNQELTHLRQVFKLNGYSHKQISKALNQAGSFHISSCNPIFPLNPPPLMASLPFIDGIS